MTQTRRASIIEAVANVAVGLVVSLAAQLILFPDFPMTAQIRILAIFTVISVTRAYAMRRAFNWWLARSMRKIVERQFGHATAMWDKGSPDWYIGKALAWENFRARMKESISQYDWRLDSIYRQNRRVLSDADMLAEFGERLNAAKRRESHILKRGWQ